MRGFRLAILAFLLAAAPAAAAERIVYLTFDDGPLPGTSVILDVIESENVPAAMFMVGAHAMASKENRALVARARALPLVRPGHHRHSPANPRYTD
ncbi:polysaccharide deacetylase family protein [Rhizobiaceae sp. 2RAB30]